MGHATRVDRTVPRGITRVVRRAHKAPVRLSRSSCLPTRMPLLRLWLSFPDRDRDLRPKRGIKLAITNSRRAGNARRDAGAKRRARFIALWANLTRDLTADRPSARNRMNKGRATLHRSRPRPLTN